MTARGHAARVCALVLGLTGPLGAHPLEEGTARVTLRDNHFDVVTEWDLFALVEAPPTLVATCDEATLGRLHTALVRRIESETALRVDGDPLPLSLTGGPAPSELRALAAQLSAAGQEHGARVRLRLESSRAVPGARRVRFQAPAALGPVVVSFVQPSARYVRPGGAADFEVLGRPEALPRNLEAPATTGSGVGPMLLAMVAGAAASIVSRRVRAAVMS